MATTTNYGWTTPDDTALVKDGAAAIRTLGSSVDTTTKNLNPETTLGDISYRSSTANVKTRLPLGTANQVLRVNSGATAPEWATTADVTPLTTKGDLFGFDTADARIPIGANNTVLTADSAETLGLKWATPSSPTFPAFSAYGVAVNQTLVASTDTKVTFNTEDYDTDTCFASNRFTPTKAGYYVINAYFAINAPSSATTRMYLWKNGAPYKYLDSVYATSGDAELSGTAQVYLNGTSVASGSFSTTRSGAYTTGAVGALLSGGATHYFVGYMDDFRVTKYARYTTTFTPATAAFPLL